VARQQARVAEQGAGIEGRREKLQAEVAQGKERSAALEARGEVMRGEVAALLKAGEELREELGRSRALYDQAQERLRGGDEQVRAAREELDQAARRRSESELK